jgi:hypothetical protein
MSFIGRLANYVLNEFLVNTLANSKTFQRFAVRTDDALRKGTVYKTLTESALTAKERAMKESVKKTSSSSTSGKS